MLHLALDLALDLESCLDDDLDVLLVSKKESESALILGKCWGSKLVC